MAEIDPHYDAGNAQGSAEVEEEYGAADPLEPSNPRYFATNASNIIYEHTASLFATMPETGAPPVGQMIVR